MSPVSSVSSSSSNCLTWDDGNGKIRITSNGGLDYDIFIIQRKFSLLQRGCRLDPFYLFPRYPLSRLMQTVDTHKESGFKSGRSMTKNLLSSLYENPGRLREELSKISGAGERDDAVASFARALIDTGPQTTDMLRRLPLDIKQTMVNYMSTGNAWSPKKQSVYVTLQKLVEEGGTS